MSASNRDPIFQLQPIDPERYRKDTRLSSLAILTSFAVLAMSFAAFTVWLFDDPDSRTIVWNLLGVLLGLLSTLVLVRTVYWSQSWMASARYGWQLKRCLMRLTNAMHRLETAQSQGDIEALRMLRFYHLGVDQMQSLEGGGQLDDEPDALRQQVLQALNEHGLDPDQRRFEADWPHHLRRLQASE